MHVASLQDDSIAIVEPPVENSGIPQGKFIKRQRLPRNDVGDHYSWKDINLGQNLAVYGYVFRITDCDQYTKQFLESEGIVVNSPEVDVNCLHSHNFYVFNTTMIDCNRVALLTLTYKIGMKKPRCALILHPTRLTN